MTRLEVGWADDPAIHAENRRLYLDRLESYPELYAHRAYFSQEERGYGDNSFPVFWHDVVQSLPDHFAFLEVGVHRGQTTSLIPLCARLQGKTCKVVALSTFDGRNLVLYSGGTNFIEDVVASFDRFGREALPGQPAVSGRLAIIAMNSNSPQAVEAATENGPYDLVYVDASHEYEAADFDVRNYGALVKPGGFLAVDDAACNLNLGGMFPGFPGTSRACDEFLPPLTPNPDWRHVGSLVHLRLWERN